VAAGTLAEEEERVKKRAADVGEKAGRSRKWGPHQGMEPDGLSGIAYRDGHFVEKKWDGRRLVP